MPALEGACASVFEPLMDQLQANLDAGVEAGASIYIDIDGDPVVDIWGGWADRELELPWLESTIVNVWSSSKMVTSFAVLNLVAQGLIDVDAPVATYWPEFAQNGKERVLVRHLLSHTAGVSGWEQPFKLEDSYDLAASTARLATQPTWWTPGTRSGYHATTFGHLNGELVRRVTGRSLAQFIRDDIAGPLEANFILGLRDDQFDRCAKVYAPVVDDISASLPQNDEVDPDSPAARTLAGSIAQIEPANTNAWRRAEIGGTNGHANAKGLVKILSAVTLGGRAGGIQFLDPRTIDLIFREQSDGVDLFLNIPLRWGIGYALTPSGGAPFIRDGRVCFWGGWGGSVTIMDLDRRMTIGYTMNQMQPGTFGSDVLAAYCDTIYKCFDAR
jgi:CubicO group peptidase (beta-lactamase class C family)